MNGSGNKQRQKRFQFSLRMLLVLVTVSAVIIGGTQFLYRYYVVGPVRDSHTAVWVADLIGTYLDENECAWPQNWEQLREYYPASQAKAGSEPFKFADLRDCWVIDFQADPVELARAEPRPGQPPFRALTQRHNRPMAYRQYDPNLRVFWRLRANAGLQVAAMIVEHLKAHKGAWPNGWKALRERYPAALNADGKHYCSFEQAQGCMQVDFQADPAELARAKPRRGRAPFRVVYPRYEEPHRLAKTSSSASDPNQRIFEHLTAKPTTP